MISNMAPLTADERMGNVSTGTIVMALQKRGKRRQSKIE
jgi:hypothetical protein